MAKLISKTYGEALFELAVEEEKTDALLEEMESMKTVFLDNPEYLTFCRPHSFLLCGFQISWQYKE